MVEKEYCGDVFREQRALSYGQALVPLDLRRVILLEGEDRIKILQVLSSQDFSDCLSGACAGPVSRETLFLDSQGRIINRVGVLLERDSSWLFCDSTKLARSLVDYLSQMRFSLNFEVVYPLAGWHLYACMTREISQLSLPANTLVWSDPWPHTQPGGYSYAPKDLHSQEWPFSLLLTQESLSGEYAGMHALRAMAIAVGRPGMREVDSRTLPHEVDWLRTAVHLRKGCYRGQETVAKLHNLGRPPRRMVRFMLDGDLPVAGAKVFASQNSVGYLTSVARHWEMGPIALGLIKRSVPEGEDLLVEHEGDWVVASVETLVSPDAGSVANIPRLPRLKS